MAARSISKLFKYGLKTTSSGLEETRLLKLPLKILALTRPTKEYGRICHLYQVGANRPTAANHTTRRRD